MTEVIRKNARAQHCEGCGLLLQPGEGRLEFVPDAHDNDDFDRVGTDRERAHWEVYCLDNAACKAREEARRAAAEAEREARRAEAAAKAREAAEEMARNLQAFEQLVAGLERTDAAPDGYAPTGETFRVGDGISREKITLPGGGLGWCVSWVGDMDGHYFLLPPAAKESAEAEKARLHRVYQWWRPATYRADSYPGPGVPESELTEAERAEVAARFAAKYAVVEADWRRSVELAVKGAGTGLRGCEAWEALASVGASVEAVIDPAALSAFCRAYADSQSYSKERDSLKLEVILRATLPATARNKNGTVKAAFARRLPRPDQAETANRFVSVRVEYT